LKSCQLPKKTVFGGFRGVLIFVMLELDYLEIRIKFRAMLYYYP
jgi:hypothetical protein